MVAASREADKPLWSRKSCDSKGVGRPVRSGFSPGPCAADTNPMAFIGGQRPFSLGAVVLAALIGVGVGATAGEPVGVSLPELATAHSLTSQRDQITGVVTLRGDPGIVRLCPGLSTIAVNGRAVPLDRPVAVHSGVIYVEPAFASRLAELLAAQAPRSR